MQAIIPQKLRILNQSVPENDAPPWSATTAYVEGAEVIDDHYVYKAVTDNKGQRPRDCCDMDGAAWRTDRVTNKYACIDVYNHTQTVAPEGQTTLTIRVPFPRPATGFGLLNMSASSVKATLFDAKGGVIWGGEELPLLQDVGTIWEYFYSPLRYKRDFAALDVAPVSGELEIMLHGGNPAIGGIVVGEAVRLGDTQYGASCGFKDYSSTVFDEFGHVSKRVERRKAKRGVFTVYIPPEELDYVQYRVMEIGGEPTLWVGDDGVGYQSMMVFGRLAEYSPSLTAVCKGEATFDIEGYI